MKKILQKFLSLKLEDKFTTANKKCQDFINAHPDIFCLSLLAILCLFFLFYGLSFYPLLDVDETRYAIISRDIISSFDWNNLMLNKEPFLEKPPLYFWFVAASIKTFGGFNTFAVRFPIAVLASFLVIFTYYIGKRTISRKFGVISALILLSSVFFLILSHVAIIDMVLTVFMTSAIYCAFLTHFCEEKNKKYYWWYSYTFMGMGFLAKGILALAIPLTVIFIYNFVTRTLKDMFRPINIIPGFIVFFLIITPWHLLMYNQYGFQFIKEYFLVHHFARFMNSVNIGRERPFLYFVPIFLLGFMPWTLIFLAFLHDGFKKLVAKFKTAEGKIKEKIVSLFEVTTNEQKLLLFCSICFATIFLVFSISSTKLPTYILPIFPAASLLTGYYWWVSDEKGEHNKSLYNLTLLFAAMFIFAAITSLVAYYFLPYDLQYKLDSFKSASLTAIYLLAILLILRLNTKRAISVFSGYIFAMFFVVALAVSQIFNFVYANGENEIVQYSLISSRPNYLSQLVTFDFSVKPSAMIEYEDKINYLTDADFKELDRLLQYKGGPTFVIVKNKNFINDIKYRKELDKRLELINSGEKYSLYVKDIFNEYNNEQNSEF